MSNKQSETSIPITEEIKEYNSKYSLSKFDFDLYNEKDDITTQVLRIKRISLPNDGERWKLYNDNKVFMIVDGSKLNNKEREFLRSVDGVNFLMAQFKIGIASFNALKKELKKELKK